MQLDGKATSSKWHNGTMAKWKCFPSCKAKRSSIDESLSQTVSRRLSLADSLSAADRNLGALAATVRGPQTVPADCPRWTASARLRAAPQRPQMGALPVRFRFAVGKTPGSKCGRT